MALSVVCNVRSASIHIYFHIYTLGYIHIRYEIPEKQTQDIIVSTAKELLHEDMH